MQLTQVKRRLWQVYIGGNKVDKNFILFLSEGSRVIGYVIWDNSLQCKVYIKRSVGQHTCQKWLPLIKNGQRKIQVLQSFLAHLKKKRNKKTFKNNGLENVVMEVENWLECYIIIQARNEDSMNLVMMEKNETNLRDT